MSYNVGYSPAMELSYSASSNDSMQSSSSYGIHSNGYSAVCSPLGELGINAAHSPLEPFYGGETSGQYDFQEWNDVDAFDYPDSTQSYFPVDTPAYIGYNPQGYWNQSFDGNMASTYLQAHGDPPKSDKRTKPFQCDDCGRSFTRLADLKRHRSSVHHPVFQNCPVPKCTRKGKNGFPRKDHLVEHMRSYHHIDMPKRAVSKKKPAKEDRRSPRLAHTDSYVMM